jgi:hypothetical protein
MIRPQAVSRAKTGLSGAALLDRIDRKFDPFAAGADRVILDMKVVARVDCFTHDFVVALHQCSLAHSTSLSSPFGSTTEQCELCRSPNKLDAIVVIFYIYAVNYFAGWHGGAARDAQPL